MPTYEYRCKTCGEHLEAVQAFTDDALTTCPSCGAEALRKVFGSVGISFKGSGFYKNDSRSASHSSAKSHSTNGSTGSNGSNGSGGEGSSDSSSTSTATSPEGSSSKPSDKKPAGKAASPAKTDKGSGSSAGARSA